MKSNNISSNENSVIYEVRSPKSKDYLNVILKIKGISEVSLMNQDGIIEY